MDRCRLPDHAAIAGERRHVSALDRQEGGDHYKKLAIQPVEYIHANNLGFFEGSVVKYVSRWRDKGGVKDLEKAKHFIDLLIELEARRGADIRAQAKLNMERVTAELNARAGMKPVDLTSKS